MQTAAPLKNKTIATWLAFLGGTLGLHRFYLRGFGDLIGWLLPIPTLLGVYGIKRALDLGVDDTLSWALIPLVGATFAGCCLNAIVYGLMAPEKWNTRRNPQAPADAAAGGTAWATIIGVIGALLLGTGVLMATLAFSFEHYFAYQIQEAQKISQ